MVKADADRNAGIVAVNHVQELFADMMALDLVMPSKRKHSVKDDDEYWSLTEFGKAVHKMQRRRRLMDEANDGPSPVTEPKGATAKRVTAKKATAKKATAKRVTAKKATAKKAT